MIYYSVLNSSYIFKDWDEFDPQYDEIKISNTLSLIVEYCGHDECKIIRVISSNPNDYLNMDLIPGNIVKSSNLLKIAYQ